MAGFLAPLLIEEIPGDDRRWILRQPCIYHLKELDGDEWVDVPNGFVTDFGSIPQFLWWIPGLSPFGRYRRAYAVHDKLYRAPVVRVGEMGVRVIDRDESDDILCEAMGVLGAWWGLRRLVRRGVRVGGWATWNGYRAAQAETAHAG